mmetsp:Transcript_81439/g.264458  ORF Transcript_81439/g.264458 Transcript_81439/m.264458 type:complete len:398 (-) Transcript_81439:1130-2323(-)
MSKPLLGLRRGHRHAGATGGARCEVPAQRSRHGLLRGGAQVLLHLLGDTVRERGARPHGVHPRCRREGGGVGDEETKDLPSLARGLDSTKFGRSCHSASAHLMSRSERNTILLDAHALQTRQPSLEVCRAAGRTRSGRVSHAEGLQATVRRVHLASTRRDEDARGVFASTHQVLLVLAGHGVVYSGIPCRVLPHLPLALITHQAQERRGMCIPSERLLELLCALPRRQGTECHRVEVGDKDLGAIAAAILVFSNPRYGSHGRAFKVSDLLVKATPDQHRRMKMQVPADVLVLQTRAPQQLRGLQSPSGHHDTTSPDNDLASARTTVDRCTHRACTPEGVAQDLVGSAAVKEKQVACASSVGERRPVHSLARAVLPAQRTQAAIVRALGLPTLLGSNF